MLTELSLTNFKAWKRIEKMRLAPITGLFGTNSSGKSSILQFLLMLKQTADSADRNLVLHFGDEKSPVSLGNFSDVVHGHQKDAPISIGVQWRLPKPLMIKDPERKSAKLFESDRMSLGAKVSATGTGKLQATQVRYGLGDDMFSLLSKEAGYSLSTTAKGFKFKRAAGRKWPLPPPVRYYGFADEIRTYHQNAGFLSELELQFEKMLRGLYYLGPLREYPRREYAWAGGEPADMGRRGEHSIPAILAAREKGEKGKIPRGKGNPRFSLEEYVGYWLQQLGLIDSFEVKEIAEGTNLYRVWVRKAKSGPAVLITDVGFGVSQVLPVLVLSYYAPEGSTILLEQPEIHLHPSVQGRLADVFIDAMNVRKVQFIIESHSEHFLRRLQRRIAEAELITQDQAALYFCDMGKEGAGLCPLDLDMYGNIRNWPSDFFGNEMEDMSAMLKAARARREVGAD